METHKRKDIVEDKRTDFLFTFFKLEAEKYEEVPINGYWLIKQWNPSLKKPIVAIYDYDGFVKYKNYNRKKKRL
ncbi:MAG TPA: hypothetical protein ENI23_08515 [bacterium]|nr:hypothetical protein [bacterium]